MDRALLPPHYAAYLAFLTPASRRSGLKPMDDEQCEQFAGNVAQGLRKDGVGPEWLLTMAECKWLRDSQYPENERIQKALLRAFRANSE